MSAAKLRSRRALPGEARAQYRPNLVEGLLGRAPALTGTGPGNDPHLEEVRLPYTEAALGPDTFTTNRRVKGSGPVVLM